MRKGTCLLNLHLGKRFTRLQSRKSHFRNSDATGEAPLAFPEIQFLKGFEPRTLRLVLFLRNSSDSSSSSSIWELRGPVVPLAACLYLEERGAPPGVGGILGFGGSRDAWKGPRSCMIPTLLVISGCKSEWVLPTRRVRNVVTRIPFRGFGGSRDSWKGPRSCMISTLLVISGSPGITRNDEMLHDRGPFRESWEMGKCEKVRKWERVLNLEPRNPCSLLHVIFANRVQR